jgi:hypothetical protein
MCDNNVQPFFSLITRPAVRCSQCKFLLNVTPALVRANWARTLYLWGVLAVWVGLACTMMVQQGATSELGPLGLVLGLLIIGWVPGVVAALPLLVVGMIAGSVMARRLCAEPERPVLPEGKSRGYVPQEHDWR